MVRTWQEVREQAFQGPATRGSASRIFEAPALSSQAEATGNAVCAQESPWQIPAFSPTEPPPEGLNAGIGEVKRFGPCPVTMLRETKTAPYPNLLPPQEPWLGRILPDAQAPWAPLWCGAFWGGFGVGLGVLRGAAVAFLGNTCKELPRYRAFMVGFSCSAPWYVSMLGFSGVASVFAARAERAGNGRRRLPDINDSHAACDLG
eukprot:TRINITY_DN103471_c0_g1_i1.p1 TRINITY_DN103471_c0_g1~~TRINITY_DN103471_c0_g1_i1.p1  ORF type:complete len:204 (+),score=29.89 TRINITY_DN103471_c0_g1_i1:97-708(+)